MENFNLNQYGITKSKILRNAAPAKLYANAIEFDEGAAISDKGALILTSGQKTGRSPKDKRITDNAESNDVWWGDINIKMDDHTFSINQQRAIDYFNTRTRIYVLDGYAGWDPKHQKKIRVICTRPYHALFMHNMLIRPTQEQLKDFGEPDYVIYNAGEFPANPHTTYMNSRTSVDICFERNEIVILGTEYAGEMKKGVFTIMNYIMPKLDVLSMHCSANEGKNGDIALFFGLSGTGKTTLSADQNRQLIGDDEHCWTDDGVFNIEGGCYAKAINLSEEKEPEIFNAIKFGTILENVVFDKATHKVDYDDVSLTQNTRASYPIEYIPNAKIPCYAGHPKNIIFLTCDAFGVLPPVSKLTAEQAKYHFINGYTAKIAGTEMGIDEPTATFSTCFGAAFMVWEPKKYANLLADKINKHDTKVWLVNTGWIGGAYGTGNRISLKYTRSIINAIHDNQLDNVDYKKDDFFDVAIPTSCPGVPSEVLQPQEMWANKTAYQEQAKYLLNLFEENYKMYIN